MFISGDFGTSGLEIEDLQFFKVNNQNFMFDNDSTETSTIITPMSGLADATIKNTY
jgi:hypothetical protein